MLESKRSPRLVLSLLGLLTLVAFGARLRGLHARLPHQCDPDRYIVAEAAWFDRPASMVPGGFEAFPQTMYPRLLSRLLYRLPGRSFAPTLPVQASLSEHLAAASAPFVRGRLMIEILSLLAIPGTYFLARHFLGAWTSLLAAAFLATSLAFLFYSEQARPHAASLAISLVAVLAILRIPHTDGVAAYVVAGVLSALAVGCIWNGVFVVPVLLAAHAFSERRRWVGFAIALAAVAAAIPVFYPFLLEGSPFAPGRVHLGTETIEWQSLTGRGFGMILKGLWSFEPALVVAAGIGAAALAVRLLRRDRPPAATLRDLGIVVAFPASCYLFWGVMSAVPPRFALPLWPYVAVLAAFGIQSLRPRRAPVIVAAALACAALALPVYACAHLVRTRSREDSFTAAARWIAATADPARDVVCIPFLCDLPLFTERSAIEALPGGIRSPWQRYQLRLPEDPAIPCFRIHTVITREMLADRRIGSDEVRSFLESERPAYVIVALGGDPAVGWEITRRVLREEGHEVAAKFTAWKPGSGDLMDARFEEGDRGLAKILAAERPGSDLEIYRMGEPGRMGAPGSGR